MIYTLYRLFRAVNIYLKILLCIAITSIILIEFIYDDVPERFNGGYKIGVLVDRLALSYVAAFIFFFIDRHYKSFKDKDALKTRIFFHVFNIYAGHVSFTRSLLSYYNVDNFAVPTPTKGEILNLENKIREVAKDDTLAYWVVKSNEYKIQLLDKIQKLKAIHYYLDADLVKHLDELENNGLMTHIGPTNKAPLNSQLWIYFNAMERFYEVYERIAKARHL